jgi:formylglycine-generating enzyme required for sulfatase activity
MMVIHPEEEFLMGSAMNEAERFGGPTGKNEIRHRRRIGRTFAIAAHKVTAAQFQAFRSDHDFERTYAREDSAPANVVRRGRVLQLAERSATSRGTCVRRTATTISRSTVAATTVSVWRGLTPDPLYCFTALPLFAILCCPVSTAGGLR